MSAVIKAEAARSVRSFELGVIAGRAVDLADALEIRSPAEIALDDAREQIARLEAQLVAADEEHRTARDVAYAEGLEEGGKRADDGVERRLALVRETGEAALDVWRARLGEIDILAAMLAQGAMAKVFSPHADLADLVTRAIGAKIARLRVESVVAVRVSNEDFAEPSAVVAVAGGAEIICDPLLKSGECRIELRLGEVEVRIDGLAGELDKFFRSLGDPA